MYFYCILAKSLALVKPPLRQFWAEPCTHVHVFWRPLFLHDKYCVNCDELLYTCTMSCIYMYVCVCVCVYHSYMYLSFYLPQLTNHWQWSGRFRSHWDSWVLSLGQWVPVDATKVRNLSTAYILLRTEPCMCKKLREVDLQVWGYTLSESKLARINLLSLLSTTV